MTLGKLFSAVLPDITGTLECTCGVTRYFEGEDTHQSLVAVYFILQNKSD